MGGGVTLSPAGSGQRKLKGAFRTSLQGGNTFPGDDKRVSCTSRTFTGKERAVAIIVRPLTCTTEGGKRVTTEKSYTNPGFKSEERVLLFWEQRLLQSNEKFDCCVQPDGKDLSFSGEKKNAANSSSVEDTEDDANSKKKTQRTDTHTMYVGT